MSSVTSLKCSDNSYARLQHRTSVSSYATHDIMSFCRRVFANNQYDNKKGTKNAPKTQNHTMVSLCQSVLRVTVKVNGKLAQKTLKWSSPKLSWDIYPSAKFYPNRTITGVCHPYMQSCLWKWLGYLFIAIFISFGSDNSLPPRHPHQFWCSIRQMASFHAGMCLLGILKTKGYILIPFLPKMSILGWFLDETLKNFSSEKP